MTTRRKRVAVLGCALGVLVVLGALSAIAARRLRVFERRVKHIEPVETLSFSDDGRLLLSASEVDGRFFVRDVTNPLDRRYGAPLSRTGSGHDPILSPDGRWIAVAAESEVRIVDVATFESVGVVGTQVRALAFAPDGGSLVQADYVEYRRHRAPLHRRLLPGLRDVGDDVPVFGVAGNLAFSPDCRVLAIGGPGVVRLVDAATGRTLHELPILTGSEDARSLLFTRDGRTVFACGDRMLAAWSVATGVPRWVEIVDVSRLAVSGDGRYLVAYGLEERVFLFDAATGKAAGRSPWIEIDASALAFSPADDLVAIGHSKGDVDLEPTENFVARFR